MSDNNFSQDENYTNGEFNGERNITPPQLGSSYPVCSAPKANQSMNNDQTQAPDQNEGAQLDDTGYYNNDQTQAPDQNEGAQWDDTGYYNNDQTQAPDQNEGVQWDDTGYYNDDQVDTGYYNDDQVQAPDQYEGAQWDDTGYYNDHQVQAPYQYEEAPWDGQSNFDNDDSQWDDSDLKNLDEIDEFRSDQENELDEQNALHEMIVSNFDYANPGGTKNSNYPPCAYVNPASSNPRVNTNAVSSQNGQWTTHAAKSNGTLPLTQVVKAGQTSSDTNTFNAAFAECTCCQGFLFDCDCTKAGKPQCDAHYHASKASVKVSQLRPNAKEWKPPI